MLRKIEKSAKSKEEALKLAAEEFGVEVSELSYEVEREVGKGLMGLLLGKETVISAWLTKEAEEEEKINKIAKTRAKSEEIKADAPNPYAPKTEPNACDYASDERKKKPEVKKPEVKKAEKPAPENKYAKEEKPEKKHDSKRNHEVTEKSIEDAKYFATELIHKIGLSEADVDVKNGGDCVSINVSGDKMGLLIGKRGDTLDAIQYLTSLYVNKEKNSYIKISVDTENYRAKREETLIRLAKSLEKRVIRENKAIALEPMSPNERRIIHSALQDSESVETYSIGEEPNRKVVVAVKE